MAYVYDTSKLTDLGQLKKAAQRTAAEVSGIKTVLANALQSATYANNTLSFYRTTDTSGTAAFSFNLPEELFLDQAHTEFVPVFAWSSTDYPGSTNPNLDGKPVLVLAIAGDSTVTYSFLDMRALVDTYTANDDSVVINGYRIGVKIDPTAGNALSLVTGQGLRVDISGKADKVANATSGDLASLDSNGNLADSGVLATSVMTKVTGATANDFAMLSASGEVVDAGFGLATDSEVEAMIHDVWGDPET